MRVVHSLVRMLFSNGENFLTRRLRINRENMVQVSGVFYYRTIFGKINMGRFTRNVYVPHDAVAVTVK